MKVKLTQSDWITIVVGIASLILPCFQNELREKIIKMVHNWQLVFFIIGFSLLLFVALKIYFRILVEDKHKYLEDEIKKLENKLADNTKVVDMIFSIIEIEVETRDLTDKILKKQIDYNHEYITSHILGNEIKPYIPLYTEELKISTKKLFDAIAKKHL